MALAAAVADPADRPHLGALTGVRALAALAVYVSHLPAPAGAPAVLMTAMSAGYYGVTVFFVLSGFVLTLNYFDKLQHPTVARIWSYGVARFARIYPIYLLVLGFTVVRMVQTGVSLNGWPIHLLILQAWDPSFDMTFGFNGVAWSVGVEVFLYATLPLLVVVVARLDRGVRYLCATAVVVGGIMVGVALAAESAGLDTLPWTDPASPHHLLYTWPVSRVGDFLLGILAARIYLRARTDARSHVVGALLIFAGLLAIGFAATSQSLTYTALSWDAAYAIPAFGLLLGLALAPRNVIARLLSTATLVLLGEASYAFYLIHHQMLFILDPSGWATSLNRHTLFAQAVNLAIIAAIAIGLHVLFERPARTWLRRWSRPPSWLGLPGAEATSLDRGR